MSRGVKKIILKIAKKLFKYMLENRVSFIGGKVIKGGNELAKVESVLKTIMAAIFVVITIILIVLDLLNKDAIIKRLKHYLNAEPAKIIEETVVHPHMAIAKGLIKGQIRDGPRSRELAIKNMLKKKSQLRIKTSVDKRYKKRIDNLNARSKKWHKKRDDLEKKFLEEYDIIMEYLSPNSNPKKSWVNDDSIENQSHQEIDDESYDESYDERSKKWHKKVDDVEEKLSEEYDIMMGFEPKKSGVKDVTIENQSHQEIVDESVNDDSIENLSFQEIIDELNQILDDHTAYLNTVNTKIDTIHKIENKELSDDFDLDQLDDYLNSINLKNRTIRNGGTRGKGKNALKTTGSSKKRKRTQKRRKHRK
jgi:hypothetical protein